MTDAAWLRAAELFERAVALPESARQEFLERACEGDGPLLARVRDLLRADAAPPRLLGASPDELAAVVAQPEEMVPERWRVGPYLLRRELGRGGMGVVYLAVREDLRNTVALKPLRHLPGAPELAARFRREQSVHAQLEHPHIARLLDAGVADDGTPWLAMEYVEGGAIDAHCDERRLTVAERLALFEKVVSAVAYAHRNLVVHRDLKPSNILVTPDGEPKLVDFGIAKLLAAEPGAAASTHTAGGALTLAFASPEQLRADPITTATDVYQLGLLLHELLTGLPASGAQGRPLDPAARMAGQDAARPSSLTRLTARVAPATARSPEARAGLRRTTPERLRRLLDGDLDTILLKALSPRPAHRYASAEQLLEDLRRSREGLPILARPWSFGYRARKLVGRHRVISALLAALFLLGIGAALTVTVQAHRALRERDRAVAFSRLLEGLIYDADPLRTVDSLSARSLLARTARQARERVATDPELWGHMLIVVGRAYENMGYYPDAIATQRTALAALREEEGDRSPQLPDALRSLGRSLVFTGDREGGLAQLELGLALARRRGAAGTAQQGQLLATLAGAHSFLGNLDSAATLFTRAVALFVTLPDSGGDEFDRMRVDFGNLRLQGGRLAEAEELIAGAVAGISRREGSESGAALHARTELADILLRRGRLTEATRMAAQVVASRRRQQSGPHDRLAGAILQYGRALAETGSLPEAARQMREAVGMWQELNGPESFNAAYGQVQLADVLKRDGQVTEAEALERNALATYLKLEGPRGTGVIHTAARLARSEHLLGRLDSAEGRFRDVVAQLDSSPAARGRLIRPYTDFGALLADRGKCVEAEGYLRQAMAIAETGWGPNHPMHIRPARLLGSCLVQRRQFEAAEAVLLSAWRHSRAAGEYAPELTREVGAAVAELRRRWGRSEVAAPAQAR